MNRLPKIADIVPVYSVIVLLIYGWTSVAFLWKLPAWLHFLLPAEILGIYSYSLLTNLLESIFMLALILGLCALLPAAWLREPFLLRGTVLVITWLGGLMFLLAYYSNEGEPVIGPLPAWVWIMASVALATWLLDRLVRRLPAFGLALSWFSRQATVFLYVLLPLSLLGIVVVVLRNLG